MSSTYLQWSSLKAIHDQFAAVAFDLCVKTSEVPPTLIALKSDASGNVTRLVPIAAGDLHTYYGNDAGKDRIARLLKGLLTENTDEHRRFIACTGFSPDLLVQVNEAWLTPFQQNKDPGNSCLPTKGIHRKEVIAIILHTRQGTVAAFHEIVSKPTRHAVPSEFPKPEDAPKVTGRFSMQGVAA